MNRWWGGALATALVACGHDDDAFRAKLAAGCQTAQACEQLHAEAEQRLKECRSDKRYGIFVSRGRDHDCSAEDADVRSTSSLDEARRNRERADEATKEAAVRAQHQKEAEELVSLRAQVAASMKPMTGDCAADDATLKENLALIPANAPASSREIIARDLQDSKSHARNERWKKTARELDDILRKAQSRGGRRRPSETDDLDTIEKNITEARAKLAELKCSEHDTYSDYTRLEQRVAVWAGPLEEQLASEKKCRASDECIATRFAEPICTALANRKMHQEQMARERSNPSGYVNTTYLHQIGQALQNDEDDLKEARAEYTQATKLPFSEARCKKPKP